MHGARCLIGGIGQDELSGSGSPEAVAIADRQPGSQRGDSRLSGAQFKAERTDGFGKHGANFDISEADPSLQKLHGKNSDKMRLKTQDRLGAALRLSGRLAGPEGGGSPGRGISWKSRSPSVGLKRFLGLRV